MDDLPTLKILTLGDASVGKTCILLRFAENEFPLSTMPTIGIEYKTKVIELRGRKINLQIWDTAGQERYHRTLATTFYKRVHGIALVFDLTERSSFDHVESWVQQIQQKADPKVAVVLVANKMDLVENKDFIEARTFADSHCLPFFAVSAKTGEGVSEVFESLSEMIIKRDPAALSGASSSSNHLKSNTQPSNQSKCCNNF